MEESIEVVVALVGDPTLPTNQLVPEACWTTPYAERPTVTLHVSADETLGEVLQRAADHFGASYIGSFTGFYKPEDNVTLLNGGISPAIPQVDDRGRATWGHAFYEVTYRDLLRSGEAGALNGDPRRPYLILQPAQGNGTLPDWHTMKAVWDAMSFALAHIADAGGAAAAVYAAKRTVIDRLRGKARAAQQVIESKGTDWASRNGEPYDLEEWLDNRAWLPGDLVPLLDCTASEAEAVLWCFGFAPAGSGLWRKNADEEAQLLSEATRFGISGYLHEASEEQIRGIIREEIEHFLESGRARRIDWTRFRWLDPPSPAREKFMRALSPIYHARAWLKGER